MDHAYNFYADMLGVDRHNLLNQFAVFWFLLASGGVFFYLFFASISYYNFFVVNRDKYFPKTIDPNAVGELKKQVRHEIWIAALSLPFMAVLIMPAAVFSYRGYSKSYKNVSDYGWPYLILSFFMFFAFTDFMVYCFHRGLHHPTLYRALHKLHHTYKYTTPFSSHAFNPCDGFGQGVPYYCFLYLFPMHEFLFIGTFILVNFWTISIHDQVDFGGHFLNTTGHHTIHHEQFSYDYGQYTTIWDRIGGTYKPAEKTHDLKHFLFGTLFHSSEGSSAPRAASKAFSSSQKTKSC